MQAAPRGKLVVRTLLEESGLGGRAMITDANSINMVETMILSL